MDENLEQEIEMLKAIYSENLTVTEKSLTKLNSHDFSGFDEDCDAVIIRIRINVEKNVEIEIACPTSGYEPNQQQAQQQVKTKEEQEGENDSNKNNNNKMKVRVAVEHSPICVDSSVLSRVMRDVVKEAENGETDFSGQLLIMISQSASSHVENVLSSASSPSSSSSTSSSTSSRSSSSSDSNPSSRQNSSLFFAAQQQQQHSGGLLSSPNNSAMMMMERSGSNNNHHGSRQASFEAMRTSSNNNNNNSNNNNNNNNNIASIMTANNINSLHCPPEIARELARLGVVVCSAPISDRKSKFVSYAAPVSSEQQARSVIALLREIPNIASACHPAIWAWRFQAPGSNNINSDFDDDGETKAGGKIMYVLENSKTVGWLVVVTRYYGGILLGPERFKHIASVTRQVLIDAGAITDPSSNKKK